MTSRAFVANERTSFGQLKQVLAERDKFKCFPWSSRETLMHMAAARGFARAIEVLAQLFSDDVDTPDDDGRTPMFLAAAEGFISAIEALIRLGSNAIDTPDNYGRTPLFAAASNGYVSVIETLVGLGTKAIDISDNDGWTPLHRAASNGHVSAIEALVGLGSKVIDPPNNDGWTPFMTTTDLKCAKLLRAFGVNSISPFWFGNQLVELTEDQVTELRYSTFFGKSLVLRLLLFVTDRST